MTLSLPDRSVLLDELATLSTEQVGGKFPDLDSLSTLELAAAMNDENRAVSDAIARVTPQIARAIDGIVERMQRGGRLIYMGAGTAGRMGILDASEAPPTFGTDPGLIVGLIAGGTVAIQTAVEDAEDDSVAGRGELTALGLSEADVVVGISASGRTPYVLGGMAYAGEVGALTIGIACNAGSALGTASDIGIECVVGPELLTGSTRLKAGTAQKIILNTLSTISMVRLGKSYQNLMVDLRATNEKLRARSERTVMLATGTDLATARTVLADCGGWVKAAILVVMTGLPAQEAITALESNGGFLRRAVDNAAAEAEREN